MLLRTALTVIAGVFYFI